MRNFSRKLPNAFNLIFVTFYSFEYFNIVHVVNIEENLIYYLIFTYFQA